MSLEMLIGLSVGIAASGEDLWRRNVSNWIPVAALLGALVAQTIQSGWWGLANWAGGAAIGFGVFLVFYLLGGMGGGDVKLMAGFGALLGPSRLLEAILATAILGGILALAVVLWRTVRGRLSQQAPPRAVDGKAVDGNTVGGNTVDGNTVGGNLVDGNAVDEKTSRVYIPYAPAISLGAWIALMPKVGP